MLSRQKINLHHMTPLFPLEEEGRVRGAFTLLEVMVTVAILGIVSMATSRGIGSSLRAQKMAADSLKAAWACEGALMQIQTSGILNRDIPLVDGANNPLPNHLKWTYFDSGANPKLSKWEVEALNQKIPIELKLTQISTSEVYNAQVFPQDSPTRMKIEWTTHLKKNP